MAQDPPMTDPRAPRFGQAITATLLLVGVGIERPELVFAVAAILGVSVLSGWRIDLYAILWRAVGVRALGPSHSSEPAIPHRFAKLLGATGSTLAAAILLVGPAIVGYGIALVVGLLAALAATTGYCLGCRMYKQVDFLRRYDVV